MTTALLYYIDGKEVNSYDVVKNVACPGAYKGKTIYFLQVSLTKEEVEPQPGKEYKYAIVGKIKNFHQKHKFLFENLELVEQEISAVYLKHKRVL